jgi:hypothetical protein
MTEKSYQEAVQVLRERLGTHLASAEGRACVTGSTDERVAKKVMITCKCNHRHISDGASGRGDARRRRDVTVTPEQG